MAAILFAGLLAALTLKPSLGFAQAHPEGRVVRSERGTCIEGSHHPLRVRKLPGTAVMSDRHLEPHEDAYVHCSAPAKENSR